MSELKTLKDLSAEEWKDRKEFVELWVKVDELRQEAIEWVKELRGKLMNEEEIFSDNISWIRHFFNITKDEIK